MDLTGKKIFVTGADGFIGSHLVETLVREGHSVRAFVFYNSLNSWGWLDSIDPAIRSALEVVSGDVRDCYGIKKAMEGCDVVMHLAALIAIPYSYVAPEAYVETNINGTLHVLQAAHDLGIAKVIHTSTSEVYGTAQFVPITEDHPLHPQSPYAATKVGADQLALSYYYSFGTPVCILRPFNTYGPRQSARAVIPTIITQIANGATKLQMGATETTRDFNFVSDTVQGFIAAAKADGTEGQVINVGSNFEISIADTVKIIAGLMDKNVTIEEDPHRMRPENSEVLRLWADNHKARELLDWIPEYGGKSGFKRGLQETIDWFSKPENLQRYRWDSYNV